MESFDRFSAQYTEILDASTRISGEGSAYFSEYKAQYVARSVTTSFSGKILDFGCGVGLLAGFVKKYLCRAELHGFDVSSASIGMVDRALVAQGRFTSDLAAIDAEYDLILLSNVLHHVAVASRQRTVVRLREHLSPGGRLIVFEHNPVNPLTRLVVAGCPFDKGVHLLPPREVSAYMREAGLRLRRHDYIVFFPRPLAWLRPLEARLSWCPLGAQYALAGERDA